MKTEFIKWGLDGKIIYIVMRSEMPNGWEVEVLNSTKNPKVEYNDYWLTRTDYVPATRDEFIEVYNLVYGKLTEKTMKNL